MNLPRCRSTGEVRRKCYGGLEIYRDWEKRQKTNRKMFIEDAEEAGLALKDQRNQGLIVL